MWIHAAVDGIRPFFSNTTDNLIAHENSISIQERITGCFFFWNNSQTPKYYNVLLILRIILKSPNKLKYFEKNYGPAPDKRANRVHASAFADMSNGSIKFVYDTSRNSDKEPTRWAIIADITSFINKFVLAISTYNEYLFVYCIVIVLMGVNYNAPRVKKPVHNYDDQSDNDCDESVNIFSRWYFICKCAFNVNCCVI